MPIPRPRRRRELHPAGALLALVAVTVLWGSTFAILQSTLETVSPFLLIALRFSLALGTLALLRPELARRLRATLRPTLPLSLSMAAGFALQTLGLQWTTPSRSAFLTALSVLAVPFLGLLTTRRLPAPRLLGAALLAGAGVYVLFAPLALQWNRGDTLTVVAALAFAFYVLELGRVARDIDPWSLVLGQSATVAVLALAGTLLLERPRLAPGIEPVLALLYLGVACTALTHVLMAWGQARVHPVEAAVIYTLEPVFASALSVLLGREALTAKLLGGGALILAALLASSLPAPRGRPLGPGQPEA